MCPISSLSDFYQEEDCESPESISHYDLSTYDSNYYDYNYYTSSSSSVNVGKLMEEDEYHYEYEYHKVTKTVKTFQ